MGGDPKDHGGLAPRGYLTEAHAAQVGHIMAVMAGGGRVPRYGQSKANLARDNLVGYTAEAYVHQVTGLEWHRPENTEESMGERHRPEVGHLDVRGTHYPSGRLVIRHNNPDLRPMVLCVVISDEVTIKGWLFPMDGKQDRWVAHEWERPGGGPVPWAVPQRQLARWETVPLEPLPWFD